MDVDLHTKLEVAVSLLGGGLEKSSMRYLGTIRSNLQLHLDNVTELYESLNSVADLDHNNEINELIKNKSTEFKKLILEALGLLAPPGIRKPMASIRAEMKEAKELVLDAIKIGLEIEALAEKLN